MKHYLSLRDCFGLATPERTWNAVISRVTTWSDGQTLTASALNGEFSNILSDYNGNITNANISASAAIALSKLATTPVTLTGTEVLTNKTLTSPVINVGSDAQGDIYYRNAAGIFTRLAPGPSGQFLQTQGAAANPTWAAAAKAAFFSLDNGAYSSGATFFIYPCSLGSPNVTESNRQTAVAAGTLKTLLFNITSNTLNGNFVITVRVNGVSTALTKTVASTVTGVQTASVDVTVANSDLVSIKTDTTGAGSGSATIMSMILVWQIT